VRSARQTTLTAIGAVVAVAAFEHGLGELLQGPVAPSGLIIQSWPDSAFYRSLQGEPAMTVVPNLAVSGVVTILLAIALLVWVVRFVGRPRSAAVIAGLSCALLLVGGGFGPPLLGFILASAAVKVHSPLAWWRRRSTTRRVRALAVSWPFALVACVTAWLMALFGVAALDYFLGIESVAVTAGVLLLAFATLPLAILSSFAADASHV